MAIVHTFKEYIISLLWTRLRKKKLTNYEEGLAISFKLAPLQVRASSLFQFVFTKFHISMLPIAAICAAIMDDETSFCVV